MSEFAGNRMELEAKTENLEAVISFVEERMKSCGAGTGTVMAVSVSVEEIFVNIAHYAYGTSTGTAAVSLDFSDAGDEITVRIEDGGIPFNPFAREDPDITLPAEEREIGGLGILMAKKMMDGTEYERRDGKNIVTMRKKLAP